MNRLNLSQESSNIAKQELQQNIPDIITHLVNFSFS
jgi:hypothetical protein